MERTKSILGIVGNETRRRILAFLSEGPHYVLEISKKLDITQPAVLKQLTLLERAGLVESFMKASKYGASRKYFKICDSVNIEVVINPRDFRITKHPSTISCPVYLENEKAMEELTTQINEAKNLNEKAVKAQEMMRRTATLLSCEKYIAEDWNCRNCHMISSLRKRISETIIHMSKGEMTSVIQVLTSLMDLV